MIPSAPVSFWHYFDFMTVTVLAAVLFILVSRHHQRTGTLLGSISETIAYSRTSSIIFSVTMTICFPLYYAYIWFWVLPLVSAPHWLYALLIVSAACEMVFVWSPATPGRSKQLHMAGAGIVGIFMWFLTLSILAEGTSLHTAAHISLVILLLMPFFLALVMANRRLRKYTFFYETVYCVIFLATLSLVGHT